MPPAIRPVAFCVFLLTHVKLICNVSDVSKPSRSGVRMAEYAIYGPEISHHVCLYGVTFHRITQRVPYTPEVGRTVQGETTTSWQTFNDGPMFNVRIETREAA